MRGRTAAALVAVAVIAIAGGWYFGPATTPREQTQVASGSLMFPGLADRLASATKLEITHQGRQTVIEKRPDGQWGVAAMHDYPVQESKLRGVLTGLTELRLTEPRTSNPSEYSRLAVDDPNGAKSEADLLQVVDAQGQTLASVIVGHRRVRGRANLPDEVYVRRPDQAQSWLAEGSVRADADAAQWLDRDVMDIKEDRIASVVVGDKALVFGRVDGRFTLTEPADHPKLEDYKVDNVGRGLESLTMQAVKPDAEVTAPPVGHSVFTTRDGLVVAVTLLHADKESWARFAISGPETVKAEVDRLSARLAGWTYDIGSWKEKSLVPTMDDLKAAEPEAGKPASPGMSSPVSPAAGASSPESPAPEAENAAPSSPTAGAPTAAAPTAGQTASPAPAAEHVAPSTPAANSAASPAPAASQAAPATPTAPPVSPPTSDATRQPSAAKGATAALPGPDQAASPAPGADKAEAPASDAKQQAAPAQAAPSAAPASGTGGAAAPASGTGQP